MISDENDKLAVLIDADNAQPSIVRELLAEISRYGTANIKRAYGDWTTPNLKGWKDVLHEFAIQPVQQFNYTSGKNATDSSMIIDAMDLLHAGGLNGFCLVSSDSDFTRLATRIRESGLAVYGFGEEKTPQSFVAACDKFTKTEILRSKSEPEITPVVGSGGDCLESIILEAVQGAARDDGWSSLSEVGSLINRNHPSFDPRNYNCQKLGELARKQQYLDIKEIPGREGSACVQIHVRFKPLK